MKKKLLVILGILVFTMFMVKVNAEQSVAITYATEGDEEELLEYSDGIYKLHNGSSYKLYYQLHDRENGYCFYATTNNGNVDHNYIDCTEQINPGYFNGTFNSDNLDNHQYTFGYVEESTVTNCTKSVNYDEEYDRTYTLNGCGNLNIVNTTTVIVENPYNRQNEISVKSYQLKEKYFNYDNEGEATIVFEGTYLHDELVEGKDYTAKVRYSSSNAGTNLAAFVQINLIGDAATKYRVDEPSFETKGDIKPYVIETNDIIVNDDNTITIRISGVTLTEDTDYTVTYNEENNMIRATVSGLGNFDSTTVQKIFEKMETFDSNAFVQELIDNVLIDEIVVDTLNDNYNTNNSLNYKSYVYEILEERIKKDNSNNWISMRSCTKTSCFVDFVRYNPKNYSNYEKTNVEVPIKIVGFIIDDLIDANVGETLTVNYKLVDESGKEKSVTLKRMYTTYNSEEYAEITEDNKIKVLKRGIFPIEIDFEYDNEEYYKELYVFSEVDSLISSNLNETSTFYANKARYSYYSSPFDIAERTFVDDIIGNTWLDYRIDSKNICTENCEEILEGNFDFTFTIGSKSYSVKKNNITIIPFGIKFNEENTYPALDIEMDPYQLDFTLYSKSAIWISSNPEVATIDTRFNSSNEVSKN